MSFNNNNNNNNDDGNNNEDTKSWRTHKEEAKSHYQNSNYEEALISYQKAIKQATANNTSYGTVPQVEHEILLSNSVACRLKIGGPEMAFVAVEEAKKCITLNNNWAKAHVRLASAYIALGNHSNDACQSLQNALRLDPSNQIAKQMLMKELRRDRVSSSSNNGDLDGVEEEDGDNGRSSSSSSSPPMYVNEDEYTNHNTSPSAPPMNQNPSSHNNHNNNNHNNHNDDDIDDTPTFLQRMQYNWTRFYSWYRYDASDNWKSFINIICFIFVLYIAFGGRFGFESALSNHNGSVSGRSRYGDYGKGNAYEQFYNNRDNYHASSRRETSQGSGSGSGSGTYGNNYARYDSYNTNNNDRYHDSYHRYNDGDRYNNRGYGGHSNYGYSSRNGYPSSSSSSHYGGERRNNYSGSDWDTIIPYLLIGGIVLGLNRFLGVPIHVMPMGFGMRRGFGFGGGGGLGAFGGPRVRFGRGGMRFGFGPGAGMGLGGFHMNMGRGGFGGQARYGRR